MANKLIALDGAAGDFFGTTAAIDGNVVVVGAIYDADMGDYSGSAYVFGLNGSGWSQTAKLLPTDGAYYHNFGSTVVISGEKVVVGAIGDDEQCTHSGSAYIFGENGTEWSQTGKLVALDGAAFDFFGQSVAISGETVVVGAYGNDDMGEFSGSAYVFGWNSSGWSQTAKLLAADGALE